MKWPCGRKNASFEVLEDCNLHAFVVLFIKYVYCVVPTGRYILCEYSQLHSKTGFSDARGEMF